jgi:hypothetical protein
MKKILLILISSILASCNNQPTCDNQEAYNLICSHLRGELKQNMINSYFQKNYSSSDTYNYAKDKGLNISEFQEQRKNDIKKEALIYAEKNSAKTNISLENMRSTVVSSELRKCKCAADVIIDGKRVSSIKFSVQFTTDNNTYVEFINF